MDKREIREIYRNKMQDPDWMKEEHKNNEKQVDTIMERIDIGNYPWEALRDDLYGLILLAEEQGFAAGFYYAEKLLLGGLGSLKDLNDL